MSTHTHDWRGIDTGRMCADCGEIERQLSGTMRKDIEALVDKVSAETLLRDARIHLTDNRTGAAYSIKSRYPLMDGYDQAAWELLAQIQYCLESGKTKRCVNCPDMEGMHPYWIPFCDRPYDRNGNTHGEVAVLSKTFEPFEDNRRA